ncbi:hypothetical protein CEUSTIGMA_g5708.t1 [Chlamydomonas eustigma]|uniref:Uncharacterized protein n=1 Tax=Chlamydomonas eustigma TaxID=1157962 RepID=A0A250X5E7_9CHLO|nr:hypothetical protein CEUSTIGMA_g5708.t1 [Chlamydomonas eustigma]|eukprot:GAX78266.1 hypothetical protein CEUSTIGMA_g5708.t1 [Chlamydomonas eustigma]
MFVSCVKCRRIEVLISSTGHAHFKAPHDFGVPAPQRALLLSKEVKDEGGDKPVQDYKQGALLKSIFSSSNTVAKAVAANTATTSNSTLNPPAHTLSVLTTTTVPFLIPDTPDQPPPQLPQPIQSPKTSPNSSKLLEEHPKILGASDNCQIEDLQDQLQMCSSCSREAGRGVKRQLYFAGPLDGDGNYIIMSDRRDCSPASHDASRGTARRSKMQQTRSPLPAASTQTINVDSSIRFIIGQASTNPSSCHTTNTPLLVTSPTSPASAGPLNNRALGAGGLVMTPACSQQPLPASSVQGVASGSNMPKLPETVRAAAAAAASVSSPSHLQALYHLDNTAAMGTLIDELPYMKAASLKFQDKRHKAWIRQVILEAFFVLASSCNLGHELLGTSAELGIVFLKTLCHAGAAGLTAKEVVKLSIEMHYYTDGSPPSATEEITNSFDVKEQLRSASKSTVGSLIFTQLGEDCYTLAAFRCTSNDICSCTGAQMRRFLLKALAVADASACTTVAAATAAAAASPAVPPAVIDRQLLGKQCSAALQDEALRLDVSTASIHDGIVVSNPLCTRHRAREVVSDTETPQGRPASDACLILNKTEISIRQQDKTAADGEEEDGVRKGGTHVKAAKQDDVTDEEADKQVDDHGVGHPASHPDGHHSPDVEPCSTCCCSPVHEQHIGLSCEDVQNHPTDLMEVLLQDCGLSIPTGFSFRIGDCFFDSLAYCCAGSQSLQPEEIQGLSHDIRHGCVTFILLFLLEAHPEQEEGLSMKVWRAVYQLACLAQPTQLLGGNETVRLISHEEGANSRFVQDDEYHDLRQYLQKIKKPASQGGMWADSATVQLVGLSLGLRIRLYRLMGEVLHCEDYGVVQAPGIHQAVGEDASLAVSILFTGQDDGGHYQPVEMKASDIKQSTDDDLRAEGLEHIIHTVEALRHQGDVETVLKGNEGAWERAQEEIEKFAVFEVMKGNGGRVADIAPTLKNFVRTVFAGDENGD